MQNTIRVFLSDDHQILLDGLMAVLSQESHIEIVGTSQNGLDLIEKLIQSKADVLVLDINMPLCDGIQVLKNIKIYKENIDADFNIKIIMLTSFSEIKLVKEVMKLGAVGYLSKECAGENIVQSINQIYQNKEFFSEDIQLKINDFAILNKINHDLNLGSSGVLLTDREIQIVKLISQEYNSKEISEELFVSAHTIDTHRKNIMKKLGVKNTIGIVKYALKNNLIS
jgi:DNA-binding NarL/FixJ family response regulator